MNVGECLTTGAKTAKSLVLLLRRVYKHQWTAVSDLPGWCFTVSQDELARNAGDRLEWKGEHPRHGRFTHVRAQFRNERQSKQGELAQNQGKRKKNQKGKGKGGKGKGKKNKDKTDQDGIQPVNVFKGPPAPKIPKFKRSRSPSPEPVPPSTDNVPGSSSSSGKARPSRQVGVWEEFEHQPPSPPNDAGASGPDVDEAYFDPYGLSPRSADPDPADGRRGELNSSDLSDDAELGQPFVYQDVNYPPAPSWTRPSISPSLFSPFRTDQPGTAHFAPPQDEHQELSPLEERDRSACPE